VKLDSTGNYITLVVQLQMAADGTWYLHVAGTDKAETIPLAPVMLVVRLWQANDTHLLRGTIRIHGSEHWAPIQSNTQLEALVRAWLFSDDNTTGT
jgi:hypothetical protein